MRKLTIGLFAVSIYAAFVTGFVGAYAYLQHDFESMAVPIMTVGDFKDMSEGN